MLKKILNWFAVFIWMGIIFYFSSLPILKASSLSILDFITKKGAHVTEFAVLFFLLNRALQNKHSHLSLFLCILYAFADETHQLFTPGRGARLTDVFLFDLTGTSLSYWWVKRH